MAEHTRDRRQLRETDQNADAAHRADAGDRDAPSTWEWVVALFGLALAVGSIGFLAYQAVAGDDSPPNVAVRADGILPAASGYLVRIQAINQGGSTAAQLRIEGRLTDENGYVETSEAIIDYVPAHSRRQGGLFFTRDPRQYTLQLRAKGYAKP